MSRVLIIGLDAADLDLIEPWVAAGWLPNIGRLLRQGGFAPMRSTMPVMSPPAWTSIISGLNPGKHGIFDFVRFAPNSYHLVTTRRDQTTFKTMFDYASAAQQMVISLNVPMTYPPAPVYGYMVAGIGAPMSGQFTYPAELRNELLAWGYRIEPHEECRPGQEQRWLIDLAAVTRSQTDAMLRLMDRSPWRLAMIVYRAIDEVEAFFWHHMDPNHPLHDPEQAARFGPAILKVHRLIDEEIGRLLRAIDNDTTVLLVSDHGGGPLYREVFLNVWLEQQGWLKKRPASRAKQFAKQALSVLRLSREQLSPKLQNAFWLWLRQRMPIAVQRTLVPSATDLLTDVVDWSQTQAYSFGNIGQIYVNLRGREAQGIVEPGEQYERLLDDITAALFNITDNGVPVVDAVYRGRDLYHGPYAEYGPDLNVIMRGMSYVAQSWREVAGQQLFALPSQYTGIHRPLGLFAMTGPSVATRGKVAEVHVTDVAPTVLHVLGLPVPEEMDGRVLAEFFSAGAATMRPTGGDATPSAMAHDRQPLNDVSWESEQAEQEVLDRLRNLGYLD